MQGRTPPIMLSSDVNTEKDLGGCLHHPGQNYSKYFPIFHNIKWENILILPPRLQINKMSYASLSHDLSLNANLLECLNFCI